MLNSGVGLFPLLLSKVFARSKVERIVLVDKRWPVRGKAGADHQLPIAHLLLEHTWDIPLEVGKRHPRPSPNRCASVTYKIG